MRFEAKQKIQKIQNENEKTTIKRQIPDKSMTYDDLVSIKKAQFGVGHKIFPKSL